MRNDRVPELPPGRVLAWSETLLDDPARTAGPPAVALWRPAGVTAAIGLGQSPAVELDEDAMRRDGVALVRRQSGGGAVLLYPGVLCWEALASLEAMGGTACEWSIRRAYAFLTQPVLGALRGMGLDAAQAGICDISLPGRDGGAARKLAGTAQLRRRNMVLVHGSLLVDPDMAMLPRYLRTPSEEPEYRRGRTHRDFCLSVAEAMGEAEREVDGELPDAVGCAVAGAATALGWEVLKPPVELTGSALTLEEAKYGSDGWNRDRKRDWERV